MPKLRLLIKQAENAPTCLPVVVEESDTIGHCIASLVDHLALPRRDRLGRAFTYSLRPLTGGASFPHARRFADLHLVPETRLLLERDKGETMTQPAGTSIPENGTARMAVTELPSPPLQKTMHRRTLVVSGLLAGCAASGLLTGAATALARRQWMLPVLQTPSAATPALPMLRQVQHFSGHHQTVRTVAWSPDSTTLASGADDGLLLLWTSDGQVRRQIVHPSGVVALAWSPAGKLLASGSANSIRFFDGRTATPLAPARTMHTAPVTCLAWSKAEGHPLLSGSLDTRVLIWETHAYQPQAVFTRHTTAVTALACQSNSATVASSSQGGVVRVWQVETLAELHGFYQDMTLPSSALAFAPGENHLAVGGNDGDIRIWRDGLVCQQSALTAQGTQCIDRPLQLHAHAAPVRAISWSPDGRAFATGGEDGLLAIWTSPQDGLPTLVTQTMFADPVIAVAWSPAGSHIAVASGKTVTLWEIRR